MTSSFPEGFQWGAATAAHQIEGGNWNNDWWEWEHRAGSFCADRSDDACDSWNRWRDDIACCVELGLGAYRFSVEWSRIEPDDGSWSGVALDQYVRMAEAACEAGLEPVVTFHHFTTPRWVAHEGGWDSPATVERFGQFCERSAEALAPFMAQACTINEPNVVSTLGYLRGVFPPGRADPRARRRVNANLVAAHRRAVEAIRGAAPGVPVGLTLAMNEYDVVDGGVAKRDQIRHRLEDEFLDATEGDDFLGVQSYTRMRVGPDGVVGHEEGVEVIPTMDWEYWPPAVETTLRRAWQRTSGRLPLYVTENGIATDDDKQRIRYVTTALEGVQRCLADGIDVRGYTYWSLLDNFEWVLGYAPHFGLYRVDQDTFARQQKPSGAWFGAVARANSLIDQEVPSWS